MADDKNLFNENGLMMNLAAADLEKSDKQRTEKRGKVEKAYQRLARLKPNPKMAEWALPLAERLQASGYDLIPILSSPGATPAPYWFGNGQKYPLHFEEWQKQRDPHVFGLRLGDAVLLDLDRGKAAYPGDGAVSAALGFDLAELGEPHQINRANGSAHYLFRVPAELADQLKHHGDGQLAPCVDIKCKTQIVFLKHGKELPHGGTFPPVAELPIIPQAMIDVLMKRPPVARDPATIPAGHVAGYPDSTSDFGQWLLSQEIPALKAVSSGRTTALFNTAFNLYRHALGGSIAEHDLRDALESACEDNGWMGDYGYDFDRQVDNARDKAEEAGPKFPPAMRAQVASPDEFQKLPPLPESPKVIANKAIEKAKSDGKPLPAYLGGGIARKLFPDEVERLALLNEAFAHVVTGGKNAVIDIGVKNVGGQALRILNYFKTAELSGAFSDELPIFGYTEKLDPEGNTVIKKGSPLNLARAWLAWPGHIKKMGGVDFYPNPATCPDNVYNLFRGWNTAPKAGDVEPWLTHVREVIASGNEETANRVISFFAHMVQKPEEKPSYAIVLRGGKGCGKGSLLAPFRKMLGTHYAQVQGMGQLSGRFNATLVGLILLFVDEAHLTTRQDEDAAKFIISEPAISLEKKGVDPEAVSNFSRVVFGSNHEDAIRTGDNERRYEFLDVSDHRIGDKAYFARFAEWLKAGGAEALLAYLLAYDISDFNPHFVPRSAPLEAEMLKGLDPVLSWIWHELSDPKPFTIRAEKHNWEDLSVEGLDRLDTFTVGDVQESPLNAGGITKRFAHEQAARWINENVREYGKMKRTARGVQAQVNKEFAACFGIEGKREGYGKPPYFYFEDIHAARRGFCKRIGVKPETAFPEIPECWEE